MNILNTVGLTKDFTGLRAIDNLDITVEKGRIHGLIGPNGSGKTTFFNLVTGMLPITAGKIYFESQDITNLKSHVITEMGIGRTFQRARILDRMTCLENVMTGLHCRTGTDIAGTFFRLPFFKSAQESRIKKKATDLLQFVGLEGLAERPASQMVWVEAQLLQIARALATEPKLLLLDEPTAGMGASESQRVQQLIGRVRESGITVIVVSHDIRLVTGVSDSITVIDFGKKIADGAPSEVQNDPAVVEAYLGTEES